MPVTCPIVHSPLLRSRRLVVAGLLVSATMVHAGGYVDGTTVITPATSIALPGNVLPVPTFNNATLTDKNTIAETNNDLIKTPSSADPVSTVTGNNFHDETDFAIKGRAGLNYAFTRTYNSAPSSAQVDLGLGFGWVHSYGMRLKSNDYGNCPNCTTAQDSVNGTNKTSSITYTDERGGDHNYLVNETTFAVTAPQGEYDSLAFDTSTGQHTLTFRNGTKYIFETPSGTLKTTPNVVARLKQIADPWGNQLNFTYNAAGRLATVTDNLGVSGRTGLVFTYDASNHLTQIADWSGRVWRYGVVNAGGSPAAYHLNSFTNPLSQSLNYYYTSGTHNLVQINKPLRYVGTSFVYYQNGRAMSDANALGEAEILDYDLYRKTTRVTDPRGGVRTYEYDNAGRLLKLTEPDGAILQFQNQADGLRYSKTDGIGYKTQYSYRSDRSFNSASDSFGNVTREQDALNNTVDMTYGIYDQIATVKDKRGTVRTTSFHATTDATCKVAGKPDTVTLSVLSGVSNVALQSLCWYSDGSPRSTKEYLTPGNTTRARTTTLNYDAAHLNVLSAVQTGTDSTTVTRSFTYDNLGRKQTETLQRRNTPTDATLISLTTTYTYDALDRVTRVEDAIGNRMDTVYDANGQVYQIIGRYKQPDNSYVTRTLSTRDYDSADRMIENTDVYNVTTQYRYDAASNLIAVIDPYQHTTKFEYDAMNRRTAVIDANGNRTTTTYDLAGQVKTITNANGETATNTYDALGRVTQVTDAKGFITQFSYDANNNLTCRIDANAVAGLQPKNSDNCSDKRAYDELNRALTVKDALNGVTTTAYDLLGNVLSIKDATNKTTSYVYDDLGRQIQTIDPLSKSTFYGLDQAGNVYQVTNRLGQITRITFDRLNRVTRNDYVTDGTNETFSYDAFGNKNTASNGTATYTFNYDSKNRLLSKTDSRSNKKLSFTYDAVDNMLSKTDYQNQTTDFQYDGANRLVSMSNKAYLKAIYQFDPAGRLLSRVLSDGARSLYSWDANGWLSALTMTTANNTTVTNLTYTRDRVGNITTQSGVSGTGANQTWNYTYDADYRLSTVSGPAAESYTYDAVGNRLTYGNAYSEYFPNSNRLKAIHTGSLTGTVISSYTYDDEGRMLAQTGTYRTSGPKTFIWDQKNRVSLINTVGANYDAMNYRIRRTNGSQSSDYYLEGEHLEAEYSNNALQRSYFRGASTDELVAGFNYTSGSKVASIFHHDNLTTVTAVSDHAGAQQQGFQADSFGNVIASTGTLNNTIKYTGRDLDTTTNLYYYRARYYDPAIGRFISEDPKGFSAGINFYAYVENNPINATDPSGLTSLSEFLGKGIKVVNSYLEKHPVTGVPFNSGFPDFSSAAIKEVQVAGLTGTAKDFSLANKAAGISGTPAGYTWHHVEDGVTMQLVPTDIHQATGHTGGSAWLKAGGAAAGVAVAGSAEASNFWSDVQDFGASIATDPTTYMKTGPGAMFNFAFGSAPGEVDVPIPHQVVPGYGSSAYGGFLIYPNKPNNNAMQSVYSK